ELKAKLEEFLHARFYNNPVVRDRTALWQERLKQLFLAYVADPKQLPEEYLRRVDTEGEGMERVICDYVAGMTDRFALRRWEKIVERQG
ncbi:MAG TPA: deoxyguanosinetriphosphate triphosphohydrolase, partial [Planctomycetota bacterium]|nr:deoxyguanosinetriphosphate triphosphohydrolase [Planctomycetota bacterium]